MSLAATFDKAGSGSLAKLLAIPVFGVTVSCIAVLWIRLEAMGAAGLSTLLAAQSALLMVAATIATGCGLSAHDHPLAVLMTGMTLVSAMAIQNGVQRTYLAAQPPTTVMTGVTTQLILDLVNQARRTRRRRSAVERERLAQGAWHLFAFIIGCVLAAVGCRALGAWCFILPPAVSLSATALSMLPDPAAPVAETPEAGTSDLSA